MKRGHVTLIIPNEHEGDIGAGFLSRLLHQAGISLAKNGSVRFSLSIERQTVGYLLADAL